MYKFTPLKRFGQNYLKDENILNKIVQTIDPQRADSIIEIGPGTGALTKKIIDKTANFIAVEIDNRVIDQLKSEFSNINLINADFLKLDLNSFSSKTRPPFRIVGNIPYNLTSPIIFKIIENRDIIRDAVFMIQLEVAERMNAKIGTKEYGILAVILNHFADVKLCFKVSPNVFYPKPKVYSAVVKIVMKESGMNDRSAQIFIKTVKAAFGKRRKTLRNSLKSSIFENIDFTNCGIDLGLRAEQLSIADFIKLSEYVSKNISQNTWINKINISVNE
ncbi:MAG: 16S rRNA (adenine(1518)-N(6)/adenine(1519)-N(6))-dimethyltransferase RsmA [Ignavibacteriales bacterium]|nr:16S rRNA (adenine(1518)-N(6)/adenine(1519)-N(6))-dimethyltransferase RsmA [Ignavibacteriales bacterium]